jgi:antitoxin (DNA-binding transcriptional repressor) of toxin-antitoxin stability system/virulence-associated protein VagC
MKTRIVRIGNSQGIRIPKVLLAETGLEGEVEIEVHGAELVIRPAGGSPAVGGLGEAGTVREAGAHRAGGGAAGERGSIAALLDRLAASSSGEEVILDRSGRPVAKLVSIPPAVRRPGRLAGRLTIRADFDAPLPDGLAAAFRGDAG